MKKNKISAILIAGFMMFSQGVSAYTESEEYDKFEAMSNYAANLYIDENATADDVMEEALRVILKGNPDLMNRLIKAGFSSLDEYTEFYTEEEFDLFKRNMNNIVYGIGVIIQEIDDYVTVMSCTEGGSAEAAGVMSGDKISAVDGVDAKGLGIDKVQDLIMGELGTEVSITFIRDNTEFTKVLKRAEVKGTTVASSILEGNIGYIYIASFADDTDDEVANVLYQFDKAGVTKVILDLRDNPGGYMDSAINIAATIVPEGVIVSTVYRNEMSNQVIKSHQKNIKYDLAVLINENTASAAEILASAIGDSDAGILIGKKSYGKGVIQEMYELWDGCAFKITTGKYYTRNGHDIHGNGIEPDEEIYNSKKQVDITKYSVFDYKTKPKVGDTSPNVVAAKERLHFMGYFSGTINDKFDKALERAIYDFQAASGLFPYGVLDISTQVKMENTFYKMDVVVDKQLAFAYEYFGGDPKIFE